MAVKIVKKFFEQEDFTKRLPTVLKEVFKETGFIIEKEIFRGTIYKTKKVGSVIYKGIYQNKPAVLKLQGLKPEIDEGTIIEAFNSQNRSNLIRTPSLYLHVPWNKNKGYGFLITEFVDTRPIFKMPFASKKEMKNFCSFYQEYRTKAIIKPFLKKEKDEKDSLMFVTKRVKHWNKISESIKRLSPEFRNEILKRFFQVAKVNLPSIPMVFSHGHISANDIFLAKDGKFIIFSNLFWSYRPQWYDLAFNIWACLQHIRDIHFNFEDLIEYVDEWLDEYQSIPIVSKDKDFTRKIHMMLFERTIGAILVDLGAKEYSKKEMPFIRHLLRLHKKFFDYLEELLTKYL